MEFPIKMKWTGNGRQAIVTFIDKYNAIDEFEHKCSYNIPATDYRWEEVKQFSKYPVTKIYVGEGIGYGDIAEFSDEFHGISNVQGKPYNFTLTDSVEGSNVWIDYNEKAKLNLLGVIEDNNIKQNDDMIDAFSFAMMNNKLTTLNRGDGGSTSYYKLPENANELGELIYHKKMNHSIGEAFCALYRLEDNGERKRNLKKAQYYIEQELARC